MARRFHAGPLLAVLVMAGAGGLLWHYYPRPAPAPVAPVPAPAAADPAPAGPEFPIADVEVPAEALPATPLPALEASDIEALATLSRLLGEDAALFLRPEFLVQRLVATIDALPRADITPTIYVARPVPGDLVVSDAGGRRWLDAANFARYDRHVAVFEAVDPGLLVAAYVHAYPLFQQAYRELGVPEREFNDRLVEVIDHLLAAPELPGPVALVPVPERPRWAFADPMLEGASIGHKLMWRIGPDHARRVKARLQLLRGRLAGAPVGG